jgi:hypothetical protein
MSARIRGAHAGRVLAMAAHHRELFLLPGENSLVCHEECFGEGAEISTRGAYAPRRALAVKVNLTR